MTSNNHHDNPWSDQQSQHPSNNDPPLNRYHHSATQDQPPSPWGQESSQGLPSELPSHPDFTSQTEAAPNLPPRRTDTDNALPTGSDRTHQIEVMQSYEASRRKDDDDANMETLQREFPKMDGSLIAAIYGDSKSLSATREMLQALDDE